MQKTRTRTLGRIQQFLPERKSPRDDWLRTLHKGRQGLRVHLAMGSQTLGVAIKVTDKPMRLMDLMPVAHVFSDALTKMATGRARSAGRCIACDKCTKPTCCRYLVAMSTIEAAYLANKLICETSYKSRGLAKQCRERSRLLDRKVSQFSQHYPETRRQRAALVRQLEKWYAKQGLDCTFLVEKQCSIYADRPLVCRQWHVADDPGHCRAAGVMPMHQISAPISLTDCLVETASHYQGGHELVLLPAAVGWYYRHQKLVSKRYPAPAVLDTFLKRIKASLDGQQGKPALTMRIEPL